MSMAVFAYNNAKNIITGHMLFILNCKYYSRMLYKDDVNSHFKSKSVHTLLDKQRERIIVCYENLYYTQKFRKIFP